MHSQGQDDKRHHMHHKGIYSFSFLSLIGSQSCQYCLGKPSNFSPDTISLQDHKDFLKNIHIHKHFKAAVVHILNPVLMFVSLESFYSCQLKLGSAEVQPAELNCASEKVLLALY